MGSDPPASVCAEEPDPPIASTRIDTDRHGSTEEIRRAQLDHVGPSRVPGAAQEREERSGGGRRAR